MLSDQLIRNFEQPSTETIHSLVPRGTNQPRNFSHPDLREARDGYEEAQ